MTLNPVCENVETAQGVPLTVTGVAQVKIMKNADLLQTASEQFLGKKEHEIKSTVLQTLEGHLRAILGKFYWETLQVFGWLQRAIRHTLYVRRICSAGYLGWEGGAPFHAYYLTSWVDIQMYLTFYTQSIMFELTLQKVLDETDK